jgi:hypothetical protein
MAYIGPGLPAGAVFGSNFEEYKHLDDISRLMYTTKLSRGTASPQGGSSSVEDTSWNPPILHKAVNLSQLGLPLAVFDPFGVMAMRITVPSPAGATQRYQLKFWQTQQPGSEYWQSFGVMIGNDWKADSAGNILQVKNDGNTHSGLGTGHRNTSNSDNGPGGGVGSFSTRLGTSHVIVQSGFNLVGDTSQNGDGGIGKVDVIDNPRRGVWYHVMYHIKWSHNSDGFAEYFLNGVKGRRIRRPEPRVDDQPVGAPRGLLPRAPD